MHQPHKALRRCKVTVHFLNFDGIIRNAGQNLRDVVPFPGGSQCQDTCTDCLAHAFQQAAENMERDVDAQAEFLQTRLVGLGFVDYLSERFLRQLRPRILGKRGDDLRISSLHKDVGQERAETASLGNRQQVRLALGHGNFDEIPRGQAIGYKTQPMYRGPLISELEQAVRSGSQETRVRTLRRITDLFLGTQDAR